MSANYEVWVEDRDWCPVPGGKCRYPRCRRQAVAAMRRKHRTGFRWWNYCADHMYGRRVGDGKVWFSVHPESPAAKRGYLELRPCPPST